VLDEGAKEWRCFLQAARVSVGGLGEGVEIEEWPIGQRVGLQVTPDILHGVELGSIRGKEINVQARNILNEDLYLSSAMSLQAVPDQDDWTIQLVKELTQKGDGQIGIDVDIRMQSEIEMWAVTTRTDRQGGDGRDFLVCPCALVEHRRLSARTPTAARQRRHQQAAFIKKNQVSFQLLRFFFMPGHCCLTHR